MHTEHGTHLDVGLVCIQVAQYIKLEMPVLQSFIKKLREEENREMDKLKQRYVQFLSSFSVHTFTYTGINFILLLNGIYCCPGYKNCEKLQADTL